MPKIIFLPHEKYCPEGAVVEAEPGENICEVALRNGIEIEHACELSCACTTCHVIAVYTPNSQDELRRLDYRMTWEDDFLAYIKQLDAKKPVVVCGDMNVAHEEIDIKNPKTNRHNAGFTDEEREKFSVLLSNGFVDTFRSLYPEQVTYSWWSYRFHAREKNAGWRIDYFVISDRLRSRLEDAKIHTEILGSDHCPVELDLK
jgi:exodeoxyribonuclease-3